MSNQIKKTHSLKLFKSDYRSWTLYVIRSPAKTRLLIFKEPSITNCSPMLSGLDRHYYTAPIVMSGLNLRSNGPRHISTWAICARKDFTCDLRKS